MPEMKTTIELDSSASLGGCCFCKKHIRADGQEDHQVVEWRITGMFGGGRACQECAGEAATHLRAVASQLVKFHKRGSL